MSYNQRDYGKQGYRRDYPSNQDQYPGGSRRIPKHIADEARALASRFRKSVVFVEGRQYHVNDRGYVTVHNG